MTNSNANRLCELAFPSMLLQILSGLVGSPTVLLLELKFISDWLLNKIVYELMLIFLNNFFLNYLINNNNYC